MSILEKRTNVVCPGAFQKAFQEVRVAVEKKKNEKRNSKVIEAVRNPELAHLRKTKKNLKKNFHLVTRRK